MPSIRKRGAIWQAQVRRPGHPTITKSFDRKSDASSWARGGEQRIDKVHRPVDYGLPRKTTLRDVLVRSRIPVAWHFMSVGFTPVGVCRLPHQNGPSARRDS